MRLSALLAALDAPPLVSRFRDREIRTIVTDSRRASPDALFIALSGARRDGHAFLPDAFRRGCRAFCVGHPVDLPASCSILFYDNGRKTEAEMSSALHNHPEREIVSVGITGTKGKSTVTAYLSHLLTVCGCPPLSVGTLGASDGTPTENTTPDAATLFAMLDRARKAGHRYAVIEVSSQALVQYRVHGIPFPVAVFTSFGTDHIGTHEHSGLPDYFAAKRSLFTSHGVWCAVVNDDDPVSDAMAAGCPRILRVGSGPEADLRFGVPRIRADGTSFACLDSEFSVSLCGDFAVTDALLASAAAGVLLGRPIRALLPLLSDFRIPGRMEHFDMAGRHILIDFAHNGMSMRAALRTARQMYGGRLIAVFGSVGGHAEIRRRDLAGAASALADFSVITADDPGDEPVLSVCTDIYAAFPDKTRACIVTDRADAIRYAFSLTAPGDTLALLGKGDVGYQLVHGERIPFSERAVLREIAGFF